MKRSFSFLLLLSVFFVHCTSVAAQDKVEFDQEVFTSGLSAPWGIAFLPDGRLLVTEKAGVLKVIDNTGTASVITGTPEVCECGQGGLLDVQVHPNFEANNTIYLSFSDQMMDGEEKLGFTAIARGKLTGGALEDLEVIWKADEEFYSKKGQHFGSRIVFDADGFLYFSVGDRGERDRAQDRSMPNAGIHRIHDDGQIPADNPFVGMDDVVPSFYTYGNRNPQGMDINPGTGEIFAAEHGPRGGDELNHIRSGKNYGWPVISYGINYNGSVLTEVTAKEGMEQPSWFWKPSIATCGISFYTGDIADWQNSLFVTSLKFGELHRLTLNGNSVIHSEVLTKIDGRPRDVLTGPDGNIYIAVDGEDGRIERLIPKE